MRHSGKSISNKVRVVCGVLIAALLYSPPALSAADTGTATAAPWIAAAELLRDTESDIERHGVPGIGNHLQALENALDEGAKAFPLQPAADGTVTLLTDGAAETRGARAAAAQKQSVVVVDNPYPRIGLYLATYYNNGGRPYDAMRVVGVAFKLTSGDRNLGAHLPNLYSEMGFSLEILKRWTEALQVCQAGLALSEMDKQDRARLYHCAGYSLSELGRFDEAATAYRAAIRLNPDDKTAPIDLEYALRKRDSGAAPPP